MARNKKISRTEWIIAIVIALVLVYWVLQGGGESAHSTAVIPEGQLRLEFLDVGQGDSILLSSDGQYMLVDAGENHMGDDVVQYLRDRGVQELVAVVGTHPDSDHIGGLDDVLNEFPTQAVYLPNITANTNSFEDVLDAVDGQGLTITVPKPGDRITLGQAQINVIWPPQNTAGLNSNDASIVLLAQADGHSALLTGDIEEQAEEGILTSGANIDCDVLKVAHHGSAGSTGTEFLQEASPQVSVISVGEDNSYGHPTQSAMVRLLDVCDDIFRTDRDGTVTIVFVDGVIHIDTEK